MTTEDITILARPILEQALDLIYKNKKVMILLKKLSAYSQNARAQFSLEYPKSIDDHYFSIGKAYLTDVDTAISLPLIKTLMPVEEWEKAKAGMPKDKFIIFCVAGGIYAIGIKDHLI